MKTLVHYAVSMLAGMSTIVAAQPVVVNPAAATCSKSSPRHTVALLELYTSEGCSSCPPADRFVSNLYQTSGLSADQVVPLSLHVDYWDYIGWKDAYAKTAFTQRQSWMAHQGGARGVYTPEIFISGREAADWHGGVAAVIKKINQQAARADIHLTLDTVKDNTLQLSLYGKSTSNAVMHYALVEQAMVNPIRAGENKGATLHHDYVVREWGDAFTLPSAAPQIQVRKILIPAGANRKNLSVTAFVQSNNGEILQALSLPVCGSLF